MVRRWYDGQVDVRRELVGPPERVVLALHDERRHPGADQLLEPRLLGSAARTATALGAAGCLALAFPLHPPGRPEKSRLEELVGAGVPTLVVQGENDAFGRPDEFPADLDLTVVPAADHGFATGKRSGVSEDDAMAVVVEATLEWIVREVTGNA